MIEREGFTGELHRVEPGGKEPGIYAIVGPHNRMYVGSSRNVWIRWLMHRCELNHGRHKNYKLQADWVAFGESAFSIHLLSRISDVTQLVKSEQFYINAFRPEYNIAKVARRPETRPIRDEYVSPFRQRGAPTGPRKPAHEVKSVHRTGRISQSAADGLKKTGMCAGEVLEVYGQALYAGKTRDEAFEAVVAAALRKAERTGKKLDLTPRG